MKQVAALHIITEKKRIDVHVKKNDSEREKRKELLLSYKIVTSRKIVSFKISLLPDEKFIICDEGNRKQIHSKEMNFFFFESFAQIFKLELKIIFLISIIFKIQKLFDISQDIKD